MKPPSMTKSSPVMKLDRDEARNRTSSAISSGLPLRFIGVISIITAAISRPEYNGVRVTPNIYTPLEEIDTFTAAMEDLLKNGVPSA